MMPTESKVALSAEFPGKVKPTRRFISAPAFLAVFVLQLVLQGIFQSAWSSSLSSVERRFGLPLQTIGGIRAVAEFGGLTALPLYAHFGGAGHRPKWLAVCSLIMAAGTVLMISTELTSTAPYASSSGGGNSSAIRLEMCRLDGDGESSIGRPQRNSTGWLTMTTLQPKQLAFLTAGHFLADASNAGPWLLGFPYIYDNVPLRHTPIFYGIALAFRWLGASIGFFVGAAANSFHHSLAAVPPVRRTDPQWIGAWYLAFVAIAVGEVLCAAALLAFPRQLVAREEHSADSASYGSRGKPAAQRQKARLADLPGDIWRIFVNPALVAMALGRAADFLGAGAFARYQTKYLETQFRISAALGSIYAGVFGLLTLAVGNMFGSVIIKKLNTTPRMLVIYALGLQVLVAGSGLILAQIRCDERPTLVGVEGFDIALDNITCNAACQCADTRFTPVCDRSTNLTYFSPCRAGCTDMSQCACLAPTATVERGWCEGECTSVYWYLFVTAVTTFASGLPMAMQTMLLFLVVEPELKSHASAFIALAATVLGFMPAGLIVGGLMDSACAMWSRTRQGGRRNCMLYDTDVLSFRYHYFGAAIRMAANIFDLVILYYVWNLQWPTDDKKSEEQEEMKDKTKEEESGTH